LIKAWKFFEEHTRHVEVVREDGVLEKTYFYSPPFCMSLNDDTKKIFDENANRESVKAKVKYLLDSAPEYVEKMKYEAK
jgi:hypothetical protein